MGTKRVAPIRMVTEAEWASVGVGRPARVARLLILEPVLGGIGKFNDLEILNQAIFDQALGHANNGLLIRTRLPAKDRPGLLG